MLLGGFAPADWLPSWGAARPLTGCVVQFMRVGSVHFDAVAMDLFLGRRGLFFERGGTGVVPFPGHLVSDDWSISMAARSSGRSQRPPRPNNSSVPMKASNSYNGGNGNPLPAGAIIRYHAAAAARRKAAAKPKPRKK